MPPHPYPTKGKIARLPHLLREEIHCRLRDGRPAKEIIAWLNSLPEVNAVLEPVFAAPPISVANFSQWRKRTHPAWLSQQAALGQTGRLLADSRQLTQAGHGEITDHLATLLAARYAMATQQLPENDWRHLRALCHDVVALRRGDQAADWLRLQHQHRELSNPKAQS